MCQLVDDVPALHFVLKYDPGTFTRRAKTKGKKERESGAVAEETGEMIGVAGTGAVAAGGTAVVAVGGVIVGIPDGVTREGASVVQHTLRGQGREKILLIRLPVVVDRTASTHFLTNIGRGHAINNVTDH